jgi:excisionase family DNA binding protein
LKLIDIQTLSDMIAVKPKTIYDWVHRKKIPYYKINRLLRFSYKEILEWLTAKKQERRRKITL